MTRANSGEVDMVALANSLLKYPQLTPIPAGFLRWNGGTQPIAGVWVEYTLRMDPTTAHSQEADEIVWHHDGGGDDVVAYRAVDGEPITGMMEDGRLLTPDPRDPDPSREGIFQNHNCWKCKDGELPCKQGHTLNCEFPHARND